MRITVTFALALLLTLTARAGDGAPPSVAPKVALTWLQDGNTRFAEGKPTHAHTDPARRKELATTQHPSAVVLSCSDSRVPPELVFDRGLGELFTVRVAGNVLGSATVASIEYAVEQLGSSLIVVLGHESCGAVKAALSTPLGKSAGSPDLDALVSSIKPNLKDAGRAIASDDPAIRRPVMQNVDAVGARLLLRSRIIRKRVEEGRLAIVHGIYGLESGKVDFWHLEGVAEK